jgi:hypothetical protein
MEVGIVHDEQGVPFKKGMSKGKEVIEPLEDPKDKQG